MKGNPGVTTFRHDGRDQIYAFVRGDDGRLYVCFWNAHPNITSWQWDDRSQPRGVRVNSSPSVVTSVQNDYTDEHFLHIFVRGNNGHLYEHFWDGSRWVGWVDHDQPVWDVSMAMSPGVVTFRRHWFDEDSDTGWFDAADNLFIFAWGSSWVSNDDQLYRYNHKSRMWGIDGLLPLQLRVASEPAVIKYPLVNHSEVYSYVITNNGRLFANYSIGGLGNNWFWRDLGQPDGDTTVTWVMKPGLVIFTHDGERRIYAFVRGSDGHLWNHFWRGWRQQGQGTWGDLGAPAGATVSSAPGVVTFKYVEPHQTTDRIYAFVRGSDNHLYVRFWDGLKWNWRDFGRPTTSGHDVIALPDGGNTSVSSAPGVVTFRYVEPHQTTDRIYAFVLGGDNHLHVCYWNGVDLWLWTDLDTP